ncbi:hypothetical protein DXG03_009068 [Asterophora parasitica]|uniref:Uncharacterized protein n=1 Tax=Asterophora parasitica TaxID=117018 RepID=A0A9P7GBD6_9AGAR|nr:hypothetical protein DXG03_009068 [Asterophora parasitica]
MSEFSTPSSVALAAEVAQAQASAPVPAPPVISAAIANFRPTPKEVIKGLAPHVFDERRNRDRRRRSRSPRPLSFYQRKAADKAAGASPLRFSAVITVDSDGSFVLLGIGETEQTEPRILHQHHAEAIKDSLHSHASQHQHPPDSESDSSEQETAAQPVIELEISGKIDKRRPRGFRIDSIRIFK